MARTKVDPLVAKQAKQKKILIGLSVVLVVILVIQVPKIMGGSKKSTSAAPTATTPGTATPAAAPGTTGAPTVAAAQTGPTTLVEASKQKAGKAQLASFSLFDLKDPFVQQLKAPDAPAGAAKGGAASGPGGATGGSGPGGKAAPAAPTFATISVNGEDQALEVKGVFPIDEPLFRLVAVAGKAVKIGIAGGKLANGKTITLRKGNKLTLVDTATGARYTLELHYTGSTPEQTEAFTTGSGDTAATGGAQQTAAPTSAP